MKISSKICLIILLCCFEFSLFPQSKLKFGDITSEQLSGKPYKPDPGADAVILADVAIVTVNLKEKFEIELVRDVRIKIVNSEGFDYADIELPFGAGDELIEYRASSFNLKNGEKVETPIPKKNFILEKTSRYRKTLKFNFPEVREGTVIEYSYTVRYEDLSITSLIPWNFQSAIPTESSSLLLVYPEFLVYKTLISGNALSVNNRISTFKQYIGGQNTNIINSNYWANNVPALEKEPYSKGFIDNLTAIRFELASINVPGIYFREITPTYESLTKKLLEREDFGLALKNSNFLKEIAEEVTRGLTSDLSKTKAVYKFLSENILWNGWEDYTITSTFKKVLNDEKGSNADINLMMIAMLRQLNIKADPVILCTRSNGTMNEYSAMLQQFNYLIARVTADGEHYLLDATNPLRPFNLLPFECLNGKGRLINEYEADFVELKNPSPTKINISLKLGITGNGTVSGEMIRRFGSYKALNIREMIKLDGEEGYLDNIVESYPDMEISDFRIKYLAERDSDLIERANVFMDEINVSESGKILINPFFSFRNEENPFISPERKNPVDFGNPLEEKYLLKLSIPSNMAVEELPENVSFKLGENEAKYSITYSLYGNSVEVSFLVKIDKTRFSVAEYPKLRDFYSRMLQSQARLVVLKKIN